MCPAVLTRHRREFRPAPSQLEMAWIDPIEPDAYAKAFHNVYGGLDPDPRYQVNQWRKRSLAAMGKRPNEEKPTSTKPPADSQWNGYVLTLPNLAKDMEYAFRLRTLNSYGPGDWSEEARYETLPEPEELHVPHKVVPEEWHSVAICVRDLCREASNQPAPPPRELVWSPVAGLLLTHMSAIKAAFRMYTLVGGDGAVLKREEPPNTISIAQYRQFLLDGQLSGRSVDGKTEFPLPETQVATIFARSCQPPGDGDSLDSDDDETPVPIRRVRRFPPKQASAVSAPGMAEVVPVDGSIPAAGPADKATSLGIRESVQDATGGGLPMPPLAPRPAAKAATASRTSISGSVDTLRMQQRDFVHALVRVSWQLYKDMVLPAQGLAGCVEQLLVQVIEPMAGRVTDAMEDTMKLFKSRIVHAAFLRHKKELQSTFSVYARADKYLDDGHTTTMNLSELFSLLSEAGMLEQPGSRATAFSVKAVVEGFVLVNLDDELYISQRPDDLSTELTYVEFLELVMRLVQPRLETREFTVPFGAALEAWLAHEFVPRCRIARQRRLTTGGM